MPRIATTINALLLSVLTYVSGCNVLPSHLHSDANEQLAKQAQTNMQNYSKSAPAAYSAMLANVNQFKAQEDSMLSDFAANYFTAAITADPTTQARALRANAQKLTDYLNDFATDVTGRARLYLITTQNLQTDLKTAADAVSAANKAVAQRKAEVSSWNALVAVLQQGAASIPSSPALATKSLGADNISTAVSQVVKTKVTYQDADGKTQTETVGRILEGMLPVDLTDANNLTAKFPDAPGIGLMIMQAGLELAQIEQRRAQQQLSQLAIRAQAYEQSFVAIAVAQQLLKDADADFLLDPTQTVFQQTVTYWAYATQARKDVTDAVSTFEHVKTDLSRIPADRSAANAKLTSAKTLQEKNAANKAIADINSREADDRKAIADLPKSAAAAADICNARAGDIASSLRYLRLTNVALSVAIRSREGFKLTMARLDHIDSIMASELNDEQWRSVIQNGLDGLVTYHEGGFTQQDANTIITIAQQAALFYIGSGTHH